MSGTAEDLFGDSSSEADTDELIAASKKPVAKKKAGAAKKKKLGKKKIPNADFDSSAEEDSDFDSDGGKDDGDDDSDEDEAAGLFDSDDSDDEGKEKKKSKKLAKKKKASKKKTPKKKRKRSSGGDDGGSSGRKLSKRERMEALRAKKRGEGGGDGGAAAAAGGDVDDEAAAAARAKRKEEGGYDSGDSYGSETFVRTKEDDDFIDNEGEDPDSLRELYAEQHFDDERGSGTDSEDEGRKGKKGKGKGKGKKKKKGPDALSDDDLDGDGVPDNPIMAAVQKMKKKKKAAKKLSELEDEAKEFLNRMDAAYQADAEAVKERRPAMKKLAMLPEVLTMLAQKDMMRPLLDLDLLMVVANWVRPLPNGQLGNVTVRSKLLKAVGQMGGENGVTATDLKRSDLGKVVMSLYMHKSETPDLKRSHKELIERWSRPIFQKSGNMRDLEKVQDRRGGGSGSLVGIARAQAEARSRASTAGAGRSGGGTEDGDKGEKRDLSAIIAKGSGAARDLGNNRVRVPFSKGFQFRARPSDKSGDVRDKRTHATNVKESREALHKRMLEKSKPVTKNQRSANISIEGRPTK